MVGNVEGGTMEKLIIKCAQARIISR